LIEAERFRLSDAAFRQEYLAEFVGAHLEPCTLCKGPSPTASGVVLLEGDEELPRCSECEQGVDENGSTLVFRGADGRGHLDIVCLDFGRYSTRR